MKTPASDPTSKLSLECTRYIKCCKDLGFGVGPETLGRIIHYCFDRPVLIRQVWSEILESGKILGASPPKRSLEIGTNCGGRLLRYYTLTAAQSGNLELWRSLLSVY